MRIATVFAILAACVACLGCTEEQKRQMAEEAQQKQVAPRQSVTMDTPARVESSIKVTRIAVFVDSLAYGGQRGIYEIADESTGQRWIGVSGIGIAERGSHKSGKSTITDER